ncbi:MAG: DUF6468 domain-containing protein [Pseudomonadota bacterium]
MNIGLIVEGVVAVLLVVTAAYCFVLNGKLRALRSGQDGLRDVIAGLNAATQNAQNSILQLKIAGESAGEDLKKITADARTLADELSVMVEAGDRIADRLQGAVDSPEPVTAAEGDPSADDFLSKVREAADRIASASEEDGVEDDWHGDARARIRSALGGVK